jgi:hypothetical protein
VCKTPCYPDRDTQKRPDGVQGTGVLLASQKPAAPRPQHREDGAGEAGCDRSQGGGRARTLCWLLRSCAA